MFERKFEEIQIGEDFFFGYKQIVNYFEPVFRHCIKMSDRLAKEINGSMFHVKHSETVWVSENKPRINSFKVLSNLNECRTCGMPNCCCIKNITPQP